MLKNIYQARPMLLLRNLFYVIKRPIRTLTLMILRAHHERQSGAMRQTILYKSLSFSRTKNKNFWGSLIWESLYGLIGDPIKDPWLAVVAITGVLFLQ
ncbi:MAG: hypothetical protein H6849_01230 [Alphaproteobacteria bacterium]|nr:MAG: hypothetical protein H6849_01230 [Alphaproteobacteria bacterium]